VESAPQQEEPLLDRRTKPLALPSWRRPSNGLSPNSRPAARSLLLRRQHHLSYAEIARVMGIAPKTVEIQIGAALKALRASLADWLAP